jgi:hypothetical protein
VTRPPAGFFPLDVRYGHVLGAGQVLYCARCHVEAHGPVPRTAPAEYSRMCEQFIEEHKHCSAEGQIGISEATPRGVKKAS